jgi:hypothetical protein
MNAATSILKRVLEGSKKLVSFFIEANKNFNVCFLIKKVPKKFKHHRRIHRKY